MQLCFSFHSAVHRQRRRRLCMAAKNTLLNQICKMSNFFLLKLSDRDKSQNAQHDCAESLSKEVIFLLRSCRRIYFSNFLHQKEDLYESDVAKSAREMFVFPPPTAIKSTSTSMYSVVALVWYGVGQITPIIKSQFSVL